MITSKSISKAEGQGAARGAVLAVDFG